MRGGPCGEWSRVEDQKCRGVAALVAHDAGVGDGGDGRKPQETRGEVHLVGALAVSAAGGDDPLGGLAGEGRDHVEVAVVVENGQPVELRCGGDEKVGE